MSLPSQDILDDIKELISTVTGFKESDENFAICERYCLSHVVHHTYPFVNRTTVKNLINSYVSRFYGHGYFKVSQELNHQVTTFLSNDTLFEKNTQYDIQWCLLSLLSLLSSNLTAVKAVPELLPTDNEENEVDDINWPEYLTQDLPQQQYSLAFSSDSDLLSTEEEEEEEGAEASNDIKGACSKNYVESVDKTAGQKKCQKNELTELYISNKIAYENKTASDLRKCQIQELLNSRKSIANIENDFQKWGNISEKFDKLLNNEEFHRKSQFLSELELMEYILYSFQTGEKIFLKKGLIHPALISVTQKTLSNYLESLQPYFKIIRCFNSFHEEIMEAKYPELHENKIYHQPKSSQQSSSTLSIKKPKISNVLYVYNLMLKKALEPFQNEILSIAENLDSYSLIQMQRKIESYFFELTSLFYVHGLATKNWKSDCNWMCSIRILSVLYNAIMNASSMKMSFLYLNIFLHCFQVYLNIIDSWISFLNLNDPTDEFILTKSESSETSDILCCEFECRPYKTELERAGIKEVPILDFIAENMALVGQSLEVLRRLGRFVTDQSQVNSYQKLINSINSKIAILGKVTPVCSKQTTLKSREKKRSIFTMNTGNLLLSRDNGKGDCSGIGSLLEELGEGKKIVQQKEVNNYYDDRCLDFVYSAIKNSFFKKAFENVGLRYQIKRLEEAKAAKSDEGELGLMVVKQDENQKFAVYPYHKIITESYRQILENTMSLTCTLVKNIIIKECHLLSHVSLLQSILLFNDFYLIQSFILGFFTQPIVWECSYSLTVHLKECLEVRYKNLASSLSVSMVKNSAIGYENVLEAIDAMTINHTVEWPLTLIFTQNVMMKYNKIFHLGLKLKWAHWILSNLHFPNSNSADLKSTYHRLQLLRFWFLSILNRINNYFMAQLSLFNLNFNSCNNIKEIISAHNNFIDGIYHHCLLNDKAPQLWSVIFQTLIPLCMDLEKFWTKGTAVSNVKLKHLETVFGNCQLQISHLLSSMEKK